MRNVFFTAIASFALLVPSEGVHSATLNFEDLSPSPASFDLMPSPYAGFTFSGWYYGPDTLYAPASGAIDLFTDYADPANPDAYVITVNNAITSSTPFIFQGASFSGYSGVMFELYRRGNLVHMSAKLPDAPGVDPYLSTFLESGYAFDVDTVKVSGVQGFYAMDDFLYSPYQAMAVPEPASEALLVFGLMAAGANLRRRCN